MLRERQKYLYWQMIFSQGFVWVDWMKKCMRKRLKRYFFLEIVPIVLFADFQVWGFLAQTQYTRAISRAFWSWRSPLWCSWEVDVCQWNDWIDPFYCPDSLRCRHCPWIIKCVSSNEFNVCNCTSKEKSTILGNYYLSLPLPLIMYVHRAYISKWLNLKLLCIFSIIQF